MLDQYAMNYVFGVDTEGRLEFIWLLFLLFLFRCVVDLVRNLSRKSYPYLISKIKRNRHKSVSLGITSMQFHLFSVTVQCSSH